MTTKKSKGTDEAQIQQLMDEWVKALRAKDIDRLMSNYAPVIVSFDIAPPLRQRLGPPAYRKGLEQWFSTFQDSIGYEIRELEIAVSGDLAVAHSIHHLTGKRTTGETTDIWMRSTVAFRKLDGSWLITHEHVSVPLYMDGSDKAATDLRP
jgi:ketosteroid isomerase-like protein